MLSFKLLGPSPMPGPKAGVFNLGSKDGLRGYMNPLQLFVSVCELMHPGIFSGEEVHILRLDSQRDL